LASIDLAMKIDRGSLSLAKQSLQFSD